ncbi:hypothetical protein B296_00027858 [Ensete ventricosum]|uniref:Uncharacterized protein n=1 Tax=Ensete ventricosum TaxID=4639 RepID=A0A427A2K4_ENSVE|nr:hypothetical protein B296_00027858 [Ensete ventricosum]
MAVRARQSFSLGVPRAILGIVLRGCTSDCPTSQPPRSRSGATGVEPRGWLPNYAAVMLGVLNLTSGQFELHLLGGRMGSRLLARYYEHKLRDVRDDGLHHSSQYLNLVGEAKKSLGSDD